MGLLDPRLPAFDLEDWRAQPYAERLRWMCRSWVLDGFGAPPAVYGFYVLKAVLYVGGWVLFAAATPGIGGLADITGWWAEPIVFQKAVLWSLLFEGLGLGSGSGPLTARYLPPVGGFLYFGRPGTTRLPPWPDRVPLTAGHRRSVIDAGIYVAVVVLTVRALLAAEITPALVGPIVIVAAVLGLRDKTAFLAMRSEHYWLTAIVFLFPGDVLAGSKIVMLALWWGAASSKLNHHFPSVIAVMVSNSPVLASNRLRRAMCRDYPDDLRPSRLARWLAHGGIVIEYGFPVLLVLGTGGWVTTVGLVVMVAFHLFITTAVPLGVPIEWNVFFLYAGLALFGVHAEASVLTLDSPLLAAILLVSLVVVPVVGNLRPERVSFLPSMRYYAGNWATGLWLIRRGSRHRLDEQLTKTAPTVQEQLAHFYDDATVDAVLGKALAFRSMHLHGHALQDLALRAVDDPDDYEVNDGEWIAGVVLGWNFGDGHLHHEQLMAAVQAQCGFEPGEVRGVFLESQPAARDHLHWRIVDAATGLVDQGRVAVSHLRESQPWPDRDAIGSPAG